MNYNSSFNRAILKQFMSFSHFQHKSFIDIPEKIKWNTVIYGRTFVPIVSFELVRFVRESSLKFHRTNKRHTVTKVFLQSCTTFYKRPFIRTPQYFTISTWLPKCHSAEHVIPSTLCLITDFI